MLVPKKKIGVSNNFGSKQKILLRKNVWSKKNFVQKILGPKNFWVHKFFGSESNVESEKNIGFTKMLGPKFVDLTCLI